MEDDEDEPDTGITPMHHGKTASAKSPELHSNFEGCLSAFSESMASDWRHLYFKFGRHSAFSKLA